MKKNHDEEGNLTPKTIKKLWITGSHRVQNIVNGRIMRVQHWHIQEKRLIRN